MSANLFHIIDEAVVIVYSLGVYRQAKVYRRGKDVYAAWSSGYVKLFGLKATSRPNVSWLELEARGVTQTASGQPKWEAA